MIYVVKMTTVQRDQFYNYGGLFIWYIWYTAYTNIHSEVSLTVPPERKMPREIDI